MKSFFLIVFYITVALSPALAQVGINTDQPYKTSEFDIKNIVINGDTVPKGIIVPRLTEKLRDKIDVKDTTPSNGLFIYNIDENCYNYYSKKDSEWKSVCGSIGVAIFDPVNCNDIIVNGQYTEKVNTDATNYLSIKVNVTKIGIYTISGVTGNGYFFSISGEALQTGELLINVPAIGKPLAAGTDYITIEGVPLASATCKPEINVKTPVAAFDLNCSSTRVLGNYYKNIALDGTNMITIVVTVNTPGSYRIYTATENGISFSDSGVWTATGSQTVTLKGTGTPLVNHNFDIDVLTNTTSGTAKCTANIPIIYPPLTYAVIGKKDGWNYTWNGVIRQGALNSVNNFSETGTVKIKNLTMLWETTDGSSAAGYLTNGYNGAVPDMIFFFAYGATNSSSIGNALTDYIRKGGCVIYGTADAQDTDANYILNGVFGSQYATAERQITGSVTVDDNIYPVASIPNDPIIDGPFGNASGRYWGEDNQSNNSIIVTSLPPNSVQIATAYNPFGKPTVNPDYSIVWYNNEYNFVYFGDSVGASVTDSTTDNYPAKYSSSYVPLNKYYGNWPWSNGLTPQYEYNSILELNAVAWCIEKAATSGINPH